MEGALQGRRVFLEPLGSESDFSFVYRLALEDTVRFRWLLRAVGTPPPYSSFVDQLVRSSYAQCVIRSKSDGDCIGHVFAAQADLQNRHCGVGVAVTDAYVGSGLGLQGFLMFCRWIFCCADFRKLYAEVLSINWNQFASGEGRYFQTEALLTEHEFCRGAYQDVRILAFKREEFLARTERLAGVDGT